MSQELTLFTIAGKRCPIYTLPERAPFMLASDLAEVYGTTTRRINEAVKRHPDRFPERYRFPLDAAEEQHLRSQSATAKRPNQYDLVAFTHAGANMLSGVLTGRIADELAVAINDAFTEMERRAFAQVRQLLEKLRVDVYKKPIYTYCLAASEGDWTFQQLFDATNYSRKRLEQAINELVGMGIIPHPLRGMQGGLFANA